MIEVLLRNGAPVDEVGGVGCTSLQIACHGSYVSIVKMLLCWGAGPRVYRKKPGPLALAAFGGDREIVALIIASGGDPQEVWAGGAASALRLRNPVLRELVKGSPQPPDFVLRLLDDETRE